MLPVSVALDTLIPRPLYAYLAVSDLPSAFFTACMSLLFAPYV